MKGRGNGRDPAAGRVLAAFTNRALRFGYDAGMAQATRPVRIDVSRRRGSRRPLWILFAIAAATGALLVATLFIRQSAPTVAVATPQTVTIRESIAGTGTVYGVHETLVGAQRSGVVQRLDVREGDRVRSGEVIAVINDRVALAQEAQAAAALSTARAQLKQTARGPRESDVRAASGQVSQTLAQVQQQRAIVEYMRRAELQSRAQLAQLEAEHSLARKQFDRSAALFPLGYTSRADYDNAQAQLQVTAQRVSAQRRAVESAAANARGALSGLHAAQANAAAQHARLDTILAGALPEEIDVARSRVTEAEKTLRAVRREAENAVVRAPFSGSIAAINAEVGQTVGAAGVARLVSSRLEIRFDVDEFNLSQLARGQPTAISSSAFPDVRFKGKVVRIGSAVDPERGTVAVTIAPEAPPSWLRAGQTVNVEILTAARARRLLIPAGAISRIGERTVVYVVKQGTAVEKPVVVRPATARGVPVVSGLSSSDRVILNAAGIEPGKRVRERYAKR